MAQTARPNLVYIFTDQQRADTMAAYGNQWIETPNLNRLSEQSFVFENAYVSSPICVPSRSTQMTGLWPHTNGCLKNNLPLADNFDTMPNFFPDDYRTAYYGKWHLGDEVIKRRGWDEWIAIEDLYRRFHTKPEYDEVLSDYHKWLVGLGYEPDSDSDGTMVFSRAFAAALPVEHTKATYLGDRAAEFIDRNKDNPFVLTVNFFEPHPPHIGPFDDMYDPDELPQSPTFMKVPPDNASMLHRLMAHDRGELKPSQILPKPPLDKAHPLMAEEWQTADEDAIRKKQASYYGLVTLTDRAVGKILDAIDDAGVAENTVVVFTSEHGDQLGEHNVFHKIVMYEQSIHVPFLVKVPWLEGRRVSGPYSHIDTIPTLLELLGQKVPEVLQGESRAEMLRDGGSLDENDVFFDWNGRDVDLKFPLSELERTAEILHRAVISGDGWKLNLAVGDQCELYDLNNDPYEQVNLYDDPAYSDQVLTLAKKIRQWQIETDDSAPIPDVYPGVGHVPGMR